MTRTRPNLFIGGLFCAGLAMRPKRLRRFFFCRDRLSHSYVRWFRRGVNFCVSVVVTLASTPHWKLHGSILLTNVVFSSTIAARVRGRPGAVLVGLRSRSALCPVLCCPVLSPRARQPLRETPCETVGVCDTVERNAESHAAREAGEGKPAQRESD